MTYECRLLVGLRGHQATGAPLLLDRTSVIFLGSAMQTSGFAGETATALSIRSDLTVART